MAFTASQASLEDGQWTAYVQAPTDGYALYDPHAQQYFASPPAAPYLEAGGSRDALVDPRNACAYADVPYLDSTYTYASEWSHSYGTTPSPALPALSPASSASASSSFSGLVSPFQHSSTASTPEQARSGLLPPAHVQDGGMSAARHASSPVKGTRGFADMQESYLQQQEYQQDALYRPPQSPAYTHTAPSSVFAAPPTTPRRQLASSTHLYRSPSAYSLASSPAAVSPYHRPTTPRTAGSYPSEAGRARRGSTGGVESPIRKATPRKVAAVTTSVDANGSPTKSIRRVAKLSIEVPPLYHQPALSASAPPSARAGIPGQPNFALSAPPAALGSELSEASLREVEQLLGELGPILESNGYRPPETDGYMPSPTPAARQPISYDPSAFPPTSISIAGVTLAEEDLRLLDDPLFNLPDVFDSPSSSRTFPQSAPAWRTSFDLPLPPPRMQPSRSQHSPYRPSLAPTSYTLTHSASMGSLAPPQNPHVRAHSAQGVVHHPRDAPYPPSPAAAARRRRSSVGAAAAVPPPSWPSGTSYPYQTAYQSQSQLPAGLQPAPVPGTRPVTPPPRSVALSASASQSSPASPKTTPKRKRGSPTKAKQPMAMFVNYSAQDAKKLLNGVAPSGSTKKRREEEDAQRHRDESVASVHPLEPAPLPFATGLAP